MASSNSLGLKVPSLADPRLRKSTLQTTSVILSSGTAPTMDPDTCHCINVVSGLIAASTILFNLAYVLIVASSVD